jgi:hypothetical protein
MTIKEFKQTVSPGERIKLVAYVMYYTIQTRNPEDIVSCIIGDNDDSGIRVFAQVTGQYDIDDAILGALRHGRYLPRFREWTKSQFYNMNHDNS